MTAIHKLTAAILVLSLPACAACVRFPDNSPEPTAPASTADASKVGKTNRAAEAGANATRGGITSEGAVTIRNGKVTLGQPQLTEEVEKEVFKSLNYRRKMIASINQNSGSIRGMQQMQEELALLTRGFMSRYGLSQAEIDEILKKGEANGWK